MTAVEASRFEIVKAMMDAGRTVEEIVRAVVAGLSNAEADEFVHQHARQVVVADMRRVTRAVENGLPVSGELFVNRAVELVSHMFCLPDGRWVAWLDATADDHLLRAEWQRGRARAVLTDAERHESAAHMILEAGVSCLRELPQATEEAKHTKSTPAAKEPAGTITPAEPTPAPSRRSQSSEPPTFGPQTMAHAGARKADRDAKEESQPMTRTRRGHKSYQPSVLAKSKAEAAGRESGAAA